MHVVQLTELASVLAYHGPAMLLQRRPISPEAIAQYWSASRNRLDLWHQVMARFNRVKSTGDFYRMRCWWTDHMGVLEEILASEVLTRVVAAIGEMERTNVRQSRKRSICHTWKHATESSGRFWIVADAA